LNGYCFSFRVFDGGEFSFMVGRNRIEPIAV